MVASLVRSSLQVLGEAVAEPVLELGAVGLENVAARLREPDLAIRGETVLVRGRR